MDTQEMLKLLLTKMTSMEEESKAMNEKMATKEDRKIDKEEIIRK
jgi:hypothetical protein